MQKPITIVGGLVLLLSLLYLWRSGGQSSYTLFRGRVQAEVGERPSPWTFAHALLAFGPEETVGEDRIRGVLLERWLIDQPPRGKHFALEGTNGGLGEQHPHLIVKTLTHRRGGASD